MRRDERQQRLMGNVRKRAMAVPGKTSSHSSRPILIFERFDHGDAKSGGMRNNNGKLSVGQLSGIRWSRDVSFTAFDGRRVQRLDLRRC